MAASLNPRIIVHTPEPRSGSAKYVARLAVALHNAEMPVVLYCPENFAELDQVQEAGVEVALAPARNVSEAGKWSRLMRMIRYLAGSLRTHMQSMRRGDLVHFQFPLRMPFGILFYWAAMLKGATVVLTAHDPQPHRWRLPRSLRSIELAYLRMEYRACGAVIVHNRRGCEVLSDTFGLAESRIHLIPHGHYAQPKILVPYPEFAALRLLAFGSIRENKGLHLAIEAVQELRRERAMPVRLTIAGSIETMAEGKYWQRCKDLIGRGSEAFEVTEGYIPDDAVEALMAGHHAVILPYTEFHSESGVAAVALSYARPIVATASGGLGELMDAASCGVAIAQHNSQVDARSVAAAIAETFALGGKRLEEMGAAGKLYLERTRGWERIVELTAEAYRAARGGSRRERTALLTAR